VLDIDLKMPLHGSQGTMELEVKLHINKGEFVVLMGESGAGKTTLLRLLAGLEKAEGSLKVEGEEWGRLPPQKRGIGFMFQDYALFEHMSIEENLLFVAQDKALAKELLALTQLTQLAKRNVKHLSGGQKQRVSLCRAMMQKPKLLLMDEPFSALDSSMKNLLQKEVALLHKNFGTTTIMISHDANSAYALADRIVVLHQGKVLKEGTKFEVLKKEEKIVYTL